MAENDIIKRRHETVERMLPTVWRLCVMRLAGAESSSIEDAVQEVFLRWLESGRHFDSAEHEKAWFIRVACNVCTDIYRDRSRRAAIPLEECEYLMGSNTAEDAASEHEIIREVLALPTAYRDVIYLYCVEGYDTNEIAGILGRKPNTVRRELARGRKKLQAKLKGEEK
ncbi:MAG: RNA polymerase sigma factor [Clostridia bacterium]|nr:RNA polymerase sigma factor [Clostridia bacterium]